MTAGYPLVSVVTPVYNGAQYLQETLDSVQAQTYPNLVHVLLDNASTDRTGEIIAAQGSRKVRIVAARNANLVSMCRNWNAAMRLAPAESNYLRLLCADDTMSETCISRMVEVAETDPEILVVGVGVVRVDELDFHWPKDRIAMEGAALLRGYIRNQYGLYGVHTMIRRSALAFRPEMFDETFWTGIDFEALFSILPRGKFGMVHEPLGWVRVHEDSETSKVMLKKNSHFADWLRALYRHGPTVFSKSEFREVTKRFERRYLRLILKWQFRHGKASVQHHWDVMRRERGPITPLDYIDSAIDWAFIRLGIRERWSGWP
jgi:glycosyltransferase involved in cell wall biosynthesis